MIIQIANGYFVPVNKVLEYINYRWKSKGRHGTHSPFVYDFVDKCVYTPIANETKQRLKYYMNLLKKNSTIIEVHDLGAGSKRMGNMRSVRKIAQNSSSKGKYGDLLSKLVLHYQPQNILELGTSVGIGTAHLAAVNPKANITTVEGCPNTYSIAKKQFEELKFNNITAINSDFTRFLQDDQSIYDLIYLDGHHIGSAVLQYVDALQKNMHDDTLLIVDDIYWSQGMNDAWKSLVADERFHCTIDLWRMGIILKRPHQVKEHFIVNY